MSDLKQLVELDKRKLNQLYSLCLLASAVNTTCRTRNSIGYASGDGVVRDESLGKFERYLCKLAFVCDTKKDGGKTMTAMVCLKGRNDHPEYLFASNLRNESDLEITKDNLLGLLEFVSQNHHQLGEKTLAKQVLGRILELHFDRLSQYLNMLSRELRNCIEHLGYPRQHSDSQMACRLETLREAVEFPVEMTTSEKSSKSRFLRNVEDLISRTQGMKEEGFQGDLDRLANEAEAQGSNVICWHQLRHYLGRLQSYRQAADLIVGMFTKKPELFKNAEVRYIQSAKPQAVNVGEQSDVRAVVAVALPSFPPDFFEPHIKELEEHGLERNLINDLWERKMKTYVHGEVNLHHHLVSEGIVSRHDYWNDTMFIATSKPLCKLCHFYFAENDFRVQSSHLNLYPKWRFPDVYLDQGTGVKKTVEDHMTDVIEHLERDTRYTFEHYMSDYKRNDSRTDSYGISSDSRYMRPRSGNFTEQIPRRAAPRSMDGSGGEPSVEEEKSLSTPAEDEDEAWTSVSNGVET